MRKELKCQKGVALIELVAGLPLAVLILLVVTMAVLNFIKSYQETKLYTQAQDELFDAIETMRYGFTKQGVTDDESLIGVLTTKELTISANRKSMTLKPINLNPGFEYWSRFFLDDVGYLRVSGQYGLTGYNSQLVFPADDLRLTNGQQHFRITQLEFVPLKTNNNRVYLLGVNIEVQIRFREKGKDQNAEEDSRTNLKNIEYNTMIFVGNASSE